MGADSDGLLRVRVSAHHSEHEPFRVGVRPGASGWDLDCFDADVGQDRVEGCRELPGLVANQEPEVVGVVIDPAEHTNAYMCLDDHNQGGDG